MRLLGGRFLNYAHFKLGNVGLTDAESRRTTQGSLLLLDIDYPFWHRARYCARFAYPWPAFASRIRSMGPAVSVSCVSYAPTKKGWHIVVEVYQKLTPPEIIALQAILGSDRKREALNLGRWFGMKSKTVPEFWRDRWNLLFNKKIV